METRGNLEQQGTIMLIWADTLEEIFFEIKLVIAKYPNKTIDNVIINYDWNNGTYEGKVIVLGR